MEENFKFPTETVELPSLGLIYPKDNPLSSGKIEMKYMTAKEEDILTNQNYIKDGSVLDKLIKSLIVSKVNYDDLIVGDDISETTAPLPTPESVASSKVISFIRVDFQNKAPFSSSPRVQLAV